MKPFKNHSPGFTLIEILVALAISGLILVGVLFVFQTSNASYILQEDIAALQQNIRVAKYTIEKDLRMTGYGLRSLAFDGALIDPITFVNNLQDGTVIADTDTITLAYIDDDAGDCGTPSPGYSSCSDLPQLLLNDEMPTTSSTAKVQENMKVAPYSAWDEDCSCSGTDYDSPSFGYQVIITSPDGSMSNLVYITGATPHNPPLESTLQNHQITVDGVTYTNKLLNQYPAGSTINFFNSSSYTNIQYYIDTDYILRRSVNGGAARKIADNIEDIQISFCGDYNNDNAISLDLDTANPTDPNDDWFDETNLAAGNILSAADLAKVRYVRVTILGRTAREHEGISSTRPGIEDHAGSGQTDFYSRRMLSFTVKIRNLGLDD